MSEAKITRAWARARRLYPRSAGFQKAYVKGARAALVNSAIDSCPYKNRRGWMAWRKAWLRGFQSIEPSEY